MFNPHTDPYTVKFPADRRVDLPFDPEYTRHCSVFQTAGQYNTSLFLSGLGTNLTQLFQGGDFGKIHSPVNYYMFLLPQLPKGMIVLKMLTS